MKNNRGSAIPIIKTQVLLEKVVSPYGKHENQKTPPNKGSRHVIEPKCQIKLNETERFSRGNREPIMGKKKTPSRFKKRRTE